VRVNANTFVKLYTGGKAVARRNLFCITVDTADEYHEPSQPNYGWPNLAVKAIPKDRLQVCGKQVGADGKLWIVLPDNSEQDITVRAPGIKHFNANATPQKYSLRVKALTMGGEGSHTVLNDDGTSQQVNCLLDDNGNQYPPSYPILYESIGWKYWTDPNGWPMPPTLTKPVRMQATPTFRVYSSGADPIVIRGKVLSGTPYPCNFWQTNTPGGPYTWTTSILADNEITPHRVDYYNPLTIQWKIYSPDKSVHVDLETTECPVYVSLQPPETGDLYHTVVHLACSQGHATTEAQAVTDTWGQFTGLGVTAWDGQTKLYYYYNPQDAASANVPTLSELLGPSPTPALIGHNGDCYAWAELLQASLNVNGVGASIQRVSKGAEIMVKNCGFITNAQGSLVLPPNVYDYCPPPDGVKGQNSAPSPNPSLKRFNEHRIVKLPSSCALNGGAIYLDPSYGISAIDALDYTHQAIEGWTFGNNIWIRASDDSTASVDLP
jgi:hypothetical protein